MNIYSTVDNPTKEHGTKSLWILLHAQNDKRREQKQLLRNKPKFSKNYRTIFGNSFLFLGVKHFYPDLFQLN